MFSAVLTFLHPSLPLTSHSPSDVVSLILLLIHTHTHMHINVHGYTHAHTQTYTHAHKHSWIHSYIQLHINIHKTINIYVYTHALYMLTYVKTETQKGKHMYKAHEYTRACIHMQTHIHIYTHACIHIFIHIHRHVDVYMVTSRFKGLLKSKLRFSSSISNCFKTNISF